MTKQLEPGSIPIRQKTCAVHHSSDYAVSEHTLGGRIKPSTGESMGLQLKPEFYQLVIGDPLR